jgi:hypothetical protein
MEVVVEKHRKQKNNTIPMNFFCILKNKSYICTVK